MATAPAAAPSAPAASPAPVKDLTPSVTPAAVSTPDTPTSALEPSPSAPATAPAAPAQIWPEDWRQQIAGNDEKYAKRLERYGSIKDVANALIATQNQISAGELRSALKANATPEETAAWRAENGIPEAPEKYDLTMPQGIVFGEDDKPFVDSFLKAAHGANFRPEQ